MLWPIPCQGSPDTRLRSGRPVGSNPHGLVRPSGRAAKPGSSRMDCIAEVVPLGRVWRVLELLNGAWRAVSLGIWQVETGPTPCLTERCSHVGRARVDSRAGAMAECS